MNYTADSTEYRDRMRVPIGEDYGMGPRERDQSLLAFSHFHRLSSDIPKRPAGALETIDFNYMIYSLGASLPSPVNVWGAEASGLSIGGVPMGCKKRGVNYMHCRVRTMRAAKSVLVVCGGALGIREAY